MFPDKAINDKWNWFKHIYFKSVYTIPFSIIQTLGLGRKQKLIKFFSFTIFWQSVEGNDFSFAQYKFMG